MVCLQFAKLPQHVLFCFAHALGWLAELCSSAFGGNEVTLVTRSRPRGRPGEWRRLLDHDVADKTYGVLLDKFHYKLAGLELAWLDIDYTGLLDELVVTTYRRAGANLP